MARRTTDGWTWWDEVNAERRGSGGGSRAWSCKLCPYRRTSGADKVRAHFMHESGHEVRFCTGITSEKKNELLERIAGHETLRAARPARVAVDPAAFVTSTSTTARPEASYSVSGASASTSTTPRPHPRGSFTMPTPTRRQSTIESTWDPKKKEEVDTAVARFFFHDHISFNIARSEYFKAMVKRIGEYGPNYTPPSSEALRTTLLDKEKRLVEQAADNTKRLWEKNGVSLIADGWSDTRKRSIHGLVAYSRGEMYFISSHDSSSTGKSADVLAAEWASGIEIIGPQVVVGFVADGEAANRAAGLIIEGMYPHMTVSFCMAHCLNNLLKDIGKLPWISLIIEDANQMVTFVLNHTFLRHQFSTKSKLTLLKYSDTRFAFNFLMLGRLRECSGALRQLFISDEFTTSPLASTAIGRLCREHAEGTAFWDDVKRIDAMVRPVVHLLRLVDAMQPCIGKVYEAMDRMIEKLQELEPDEDRYDQIRSLCVSRWNSYSSPLHAAAYMVDPEFQGCGQESDREVSDGWRRILDRLVPDASIRRKIRDQLSAYRSFRGAFGCADAQEDKMKVGSALWWEDYGSDGPELQQLAIRILSQAVSSSCLEQLWSSYSHVASKKRNRLGVERANDLVFISANLRMLCKGAVAKADPFTEWEMEQENAAHEQSATTEQSPEEDACTSVHIASHDHEATTSYALGSH